MHIPPYAGAVTWYDHPVGMYLCSVDRRRQSLLSGHGVVVEVIFVLLEADKVDHRAQLATEPEHTYTHKYK